MLQLSVLIFIILIIYWNNTLEHNLCLSTKLKYILIITIIDDINNNKFTFLRACLFTFVPFLHFCGSQKWKLS